MNPLGLGLFKPDEPISVRYNVGSIIGRIWWRREMSGVFQDAAYKFCYIMLPSCTIKRCTKPILLNIYHNFNTVRAELCTDPLWYVVNVYRIGLVKHTLDLYVRMTRTQTCCLLTGRVELQKLRNTHWISQIPRMESIGYQRAPPPKKTEGSIYKALGLLKKTGIKLRFKGLYNLLELSVSCRSVFARFPCQYNNHLHGASRDDKAIVSTLSKCLSCRGFIFAFRLVRGLSTVI